MTDPRNDKSPTTTAGYKDDDYDVKITYSESNILDDLSNPNQMATSGRKIEVTIADERKDEFDVTLHVTDNVNRGPSASMSTFENFPDGGHEEFKEKLTLQKSDVPYYQPDFPDIQSHMPKGERISPLIREWSDNEPFRA